MATSMGGNSDLDSKCLNSRKAATFLCMAPLPLKNKEKEREDLMLEQMAVLLK